MTDSPTSQHFLRKLFNDWVRDPESVEPADYEAALAKVRIHLHRFPNLQDPERDEVAADVLLKVFRMARTPQQETIVSDGYFYKIINNAAMDRLRLRLSSPLQVSWPTTDGELSVEAESMTDDDVSSRLEAVATAASVRKALAQLLVDGDQVAFKTVTIALDETQRNGSRPSNRAIAALLGVSHTAVAKALDRFRDRLGDRLAD